jgi:putative endonuclease
MITPTTVATGRKAEDMAAHYLQALNYTIADRNWRRRECEIDIVAIRASTAYFVEVKYRASDSAGDGLEYIGPKKLRQMAYAAHRWVAENRWHGDYSLAALEVSGPAFAVTAFIDCIYD